MFSVGRLLGRGQAIVSRRVRGRGRQIQDLGQSKVKSLAQGDRGGRAEGGGRGGKVHAGLLSPRTGQTRALKVR